MTDYSDQGAVPIDDAAVEDPPTVDEVLERQRREFPEQARTSTQQPPGVAEDGVHVANDDAADDDHGASPPSD